jgi:hypothetical protein
MATAELAEVSRSLRSVMGESAGQFRQAATASSASLSKIVKDLANTFSSQRKDIIDLHNTIAEGQYASEQTNEKVDGLTRIFQESVSLQTTMLGTLNNISRNIKILNDTTESMNRSLNNSLVGQGSNSVLGSLTAGFGNVAAAIGGMAVAGAIGYGASQLSGGVTSGPVGKGVGESGSSSEAMSFFQSKGWSKEQSAGIVGNLQTESGKNLRTDAVGDSGQAYGIAQWHPDRQRKFQEVMGIPIRQSNFKQQLEFVQWELTNTEKRAGEMLKAASSAIDAAKAIDYGYERSSHQHLGQRMANAVALAKSEGSSTPTTTQSTSTTSGATTATATPTNKPESIPSATSLRTETIGKEGGHGPISGAMHGEGHAEKMENSASLPSGDLVALGNALKGMKVQVSEHPAFGGVSPTAHGKNSAHYDNMAIDINAPGGIVEAQDPTWGPKFDQLAKQIQAAGYTVLWRTKGHQDHIHAQIGGKGIRGGQSVIGGQVTPSAGETPTTPGSSAPQMTPPTPGMTTSPSVVSAPSAAEPVTQAPMTQAAMAPQTAGFPMGQLMGMMGGMLPMGLGGILGSVLPMIGSALEGIESTPMPFAELTPKPTVSNQNVQRVKEAAIESQRMAETQTPQIVATQNVPSPQGGTGSMSPADASGYAYNLPGDVGWPDWAALIGGNHWEEMKHYKKHMAG